jgi:hypothetical protein
MKGVSPMIFIPGTAAPHNAIRITGKITSGDGSIWIWANDGEKGKVNHYEMLKQFAVIADGVTIDENTYKVFRNARSDADTDCGGDYLTGQSGDKIDERNCVYWTGGFDVLFQKIDGYGKDMDGATFTLYKANDAGTAITEPFQRSQQDVTAVSGNIHENAAVMIKVKGAGNTTEDRAVYGNGLAVFEKIPPGVYFMKETKVVDSNGTDFTSKYRTVEEQYKIVLDKMGWYTIYAPSYGSDGKPDWTVASLPTAPTSNFVKDSNGKYTKPASPASVGDLEVYTVLNIAPTATRKVILRKVDSAYKPLDKPVFTVYYADGQSIVRLQKQNGIVETLKDLKAQSSGVTWIGTLPYGIYYLVETTDAEGNSLERESWIRYTLTVGDDSVTAPGSRDGVVIKGPN